jgi:uncharacterized FlaG/YvyC family protein
MSKKIKKHRNASAIPAKSRNSAGEMKHRLEPKEGAKNEHREYLEEAKENIEKINKELEKDHKVLEVAEKEYLEEENEFELL